MKNKKNYESASNKGLIKGAEAIEKELADGFEFIARIEKAVSIFGSGRFEPDNPHYKQAELMAQMLAKDGFTVITGGGPGIMEAGNKGANEAGGESVGLNILLPHEQNYNKYVTKGIEFNHFFTRKVVFAAASSYYIYFPGGFGTLDEFFEMVNLVHNRKIHNPPLCIAIGLDYWKPLFEWLKENVYRKHRAIGHEDFELVHLVNSPGDAMEIIRKAESLK